MDYKYIEQLVDRYFAAETTLQEEQILRTFFAAAGDELPQELAQYAPIFTAMAEQDTLGDDFDERLLAMTSHEEAPVVVKARTISMMERLRPLFGAAAVVAILLTLGNAINQSFKKDNSWSDVPVVADTHKAKPTGAPIVAYGQSSDSLSLPGELPIQALPVDSLPSIGLD